MTRPITEIKHRPGKKTQQWTCELVASGAPRWVRLRYVTTEPHQIARTRLPTGTVTDAVYWSDRPYHVWRFTGPCGKHLGYRFDVSTDISISEAAVVWTDLVLDLWVPAAGEPVWQDADELGSLLRRGCLTQEQAARARWAKKRLDGEWSEVIEEAFGGRSER